MNCKRDRQKEIKKMKHCCSWVTQPPLPRPQSDVSANCSKSALVLVSWCSRKPGLCCCQGLFFFFHVNLQGASWCSYPQRASKRAWVCDGSRGVAFSHQWVARKAKSCSFTRGVMDARIQSTPPSKLQKQVSVPRCKKKDSLTHALFFLQIQSG